MQLANYSTDVQQVNNKKGLQVSILPTELTSISILRSMVSVSLPTSSVVESPSEDFSGTSFLSQVSFCSVGTFSCSDKTSVPVGVTSPSPLSSSFSLFSLSGTIPKKVARNAEFLSKGNSGDAKSYSDKLNYWIQYIQYLDITVGPLPLYEAKLP